jgi:hypothetical protein
VRNSNVRSEKFSIQEERVMKKGHALVIAAAFAAICLLPGSAFAAGAICPSLGVPPPGTTVYGGLEVNGVCSLNNVTIYGGVVVDPAGQLELENSVVYNGIVVNGGELDLGHGILTPGGGTGNPNTINGGIVFNGALDFDIFNVRVNGGINATGFFSNIPSMCNSTINGNVTISNATISPYRMNIGDPDLAEAGFSCPGNTINGSLLMSNVNGLVEIEGNTITGSVTLLNSNNVDFSNNTVGGSAICIGTHITVPEGGDDFGNTTRGLLNSCPN